MNEWYGESLAHLESLLSETADLPFWCNPEQEYAKAIRWCLECVGKTYHPTPCGTEFQTVACSFRHYG